MSWRITIDQIASSGAFQRYGPINVAMFNLSDAIDEALQSLRLAVAEEGDYQITATYKP